MIQLHYDAYVAHGAGNTEALEDPEETSAGVEHVGMTEPDTKTPSFHHMRDIQVQNEERHEESSIIYVKQVVGRVHPFITLEKTKHPHFQHILSSYFLTLSSLV